MYMRGPAAAVCELFCCLLSPSLKFTRSVVLILFTCCFKTFPFSQVVLERKTPHHKPQHNHKRNHAVYHFRHPGDCLWPRCRSEQYYF